MGDPDTAWHLAAGDLIRSLHAIPVRDPWSFTADDEKWYNLSWLFDVCFSALFAATGFSGIFTLTLFVFALSLTLMAIHCLRRGASPVAVTVTLLLALLVVYVGTLARPHMISTLLTVIFYLVLQRYRSSGHWRDLIWLPPLMALWVNLHGGFIFAFFLMGMFWLEALWRHDSKRCRDYALVIALCLGATLMNPYGFGIYFGVYRTISGTFGQTFVLEWKPVEIGHNLPMTLLLFLLLLVGNATDRSIALIDRALGVGVMLLALFSIRHSVMAALLVMPYLSLRLTRLIQESPFAARLHRLDETIAQDMRKKDIRIMVIIMSAASLALVASPFPRDTLLADPVGFPKKLFPAESAAFITQYYPHLRFYNDYNIGGYLVYIWRGSTKVFIDGRASSLYNEALLQDYPDFALYEGYGPRAESIVNQYHIEGAIVLNDNPYAGYWKWNPHWKPVHSDSVASVYLHKD